jgi:dTMP kinase
MADPATTSPSRSSGRLIVFEGGEGSGKSTQAERLATRLGAVLTHEPGATELGAALRRLLLDERSAPVDERAEALLMAADRAQHVAEVIRPALAQGRTVVCDRYIGSSLAYQGVGRGLGVAAVAALSAFAVDDCTPDAVVLLDVPPDVAAARLADRAGHADRLEAAGDEFHTRVRGGYLALAAEDPDRWVVVSGAGEPDEVTDRVLDALVGRLGPLT